jgi:hypothetical protein
MQANELRLLSVCKPCSLPKWEVENMLCLKEWKFVRFHNISIFSVRSVDS